MIYFLENQMLNLWNYGTTNTVDDITEIKQLIKAMMIILENHRSGN
jgi:hypothetical protein